MSANIYAIPLSRREGFDLRCSTPSSFLESLERAFFIDAHKRPVFNKCNIDRLQGMAAMHGKKSDDEADNPYYLLIRAIEQHGDVELQVEY
mgnify:CR=1 FL=1